MLTRADAHNPVLMFDGVMFTVGAVVFVVFVTLFDVVGEGVTEGVVVSPPTARRERTTKATRASQSTSACCCAGARHRGLPRMSVARMLSEWIRSTDHR